MLILKKKQLLFCQFMELNSYSDKLPYRVVINSFLEWVGRKSKSLCRNKYQFCEVLLNRGQPLLPNKGHQWRNLLGCDQFAVLSTLCLVKRLVENLDFCQNSFPAEKSTKVRSFQKKKISTLFFTSLLVDSLCFKLKVK